MTIEVAGLLGVILAAIAIATALALAWPVFKSKTATATIDLLRTELDAESIARQNAERRCDRELSELRGQLSVLTGTFAELLAEKVALALTSAVVTALASSGLLERRDGPGD